MRSPRWQRNQRLKCECGGYWFPHRRAGGLCLHSPTAALHRALRSGDKAAVIDAQIELSESGYVPYAWRKPQLIEGVPF